MRAEGWQGKCICQDIQPWFAKAVIKHPWDLEGSIHSNCSEDKIPSGRCWSLLPYNQIDSQDNKKSSVSGNSLNSLSDRFSSFKFCIAINTVEWNAIFWVLIRATSYDTLFCKAWTQKFSSQTVVLVRGNISADDKCVLSRCSNIDVFFKIEWHRYYLINFQNKPKGSVLWYKM